MIEKIYAYSKEKKIFKKYAFLPSLTVTNPLIFLPWHQSPHFDVSIISHLRH